MARYDLLLHVDKLDNSINIAFTNVLNYSKALTGKESYRMVLVVNSKAVTLLKASNTDIKDALEAAVAVGLDVRVCQNALNSTGVKAEELYSQCRIVPAGLVEIVDLQREGFAYIKP